MTSEQHTQLHAPAGEADSDAAVDATVGDDNPENVPAKAWVTMGIFAVFVIAFGTCASNFMFN
ncbi:hypothetical protein [Leucobacter komagatae]|uniref:Uncharacterized protein n=1 Tax=Leucobacter komagatae TaxID=55969 RepID=A0A0D0H6J1_9MICO|nr:hypothetical protein [Leucobacter komagatae]KIP52805.1 hypothetical protein SD72_06140 [Leucobacter komagatae]